MGFKLPSEIHRFTFPNQVNDNIQLWVKRDDEIHTDISGNKYRKLIPNIAHIKKSGLKGMITFGGAFSNHIYSTAAACHEFQIPCVGIIRGESLAIENPTISYANSMGMEIHFVDRNNYRNRNESAAIKEIINKYPDYFVVEEGGNNAISLIGLAAMVDEILDQTTNLDFIAVAAGTGNTAAGILKRLVDKQSSIKLIVIPVLKGGFMRKEILHIAKLEDTDQLEVYDDYHFGGYAKYSEDLITYINKFTTHNKINIDHIYNGKLLFALDALIAKQKFEINTSILWIHTGGLQGVNGFNSVTTGQKILKH